jgi:CheY-like chemotaxis protein
LRFARVTYVKELPMSRGTLLCGIENRDLALIFEKALVGEGYRVFVVNDGSEAIAAADEEVPDLLVLDVSLPKVDGFSVLEKIRELASADAPNGGRVPAILLSDGRISPQYQKRADELGADRLISKPVPLDDFMTQVETLLKPAIAAAGGQAVAAKRAGAGQGATHEMSGSLEEVPFPQLIHELHGMRANGVLMLESGKKRKALQMRDGYPIAIRSNLVPECLGNFLVRKGVLGADEHRESLARMKRGEGLQGEILVAMEVLEEEAISEAIQDQALEKLCEIFEWREGRFKFERGGRLKRSNAIAVGTSPANAILEGVRSRYPLESLDTHLSHLAFRYAVPARTSFYRYQDVALNTVESALIDELDGSQPLSQITQRDEATRRALFGLLVTGTLDLVSVRADAPAGGRGVGGSKGARPERRESDSVLRREITALAEQLEGKSHYDVLGVDVEFSDLELERNYEKLARRSHPDRFAGSGVGVRELADDVAKIVNEAFEILRDPKSRWAYDSELRKGRREANQEAEGRKALEAETQFQRGQGLMRQRRYEDSLCAFGKALEFNDNDGEYHAYYGWCLYLCHQDDPAMIEEALEHVQRGTALARESEKPYLFLGRLYKVVGKIEQAEKMFTLAIQWQPDSVEALRELRLINLRKEKSKGLIRRLLRR